MAVIHCRHFNGYKPCGLSSVCESSCPKKSIPKHRILVLHLGAMGAVLRATALLPAIKRKYSNSYITWLTDKPSDKLLENNPLIDKVVVNNYANLLELSNFEFDIVFNIEKSLLSGGILKMINYKSLFGFRIDERSGAIIPATSHANELWQLGLSNQKKFFENMKSETQLLTESLNLGPFKRDPYILELSNLDKDLAHKRRKYWSPHGEVIVGLNTGCANTIPYKKLSIQSQKNLISEIGNWPNVNVVLLGGPEDTERNNQIAQGSDVIVSPTTNGLRDGLSSVEACDIVVSGDSLGMHMAIALKKWVIAWFGPTCEQEVDLYNRGVKILSPVPCSPCWKRSCDKKPMCYDLVSQQELFIAVKKGIEFLGDKTQVSYTASL